MFSVVLQKCLYSDIVLFSVYQQRDAALCLGEILHKVSPKVSEVFQGQLNDSTICSGCKSIIKEVKPFLILPLSPKDSTNRNYNVEGGFEEIFKDESLSGDNMVYCDKCNKKTEATSTCQMVEYPRILILVLERFDMDYSTMRYVTSDRCVEIPESLQRENETFKLYGMVNHMGGLRGGHYTATILSEEDHTWYEFNDHQVEQTKEQPFPNNRPYCSRTAYLLFYRGGANSASILMKPLSILKKPLSILKKPLIAVIVVGGFALTVVLIKTQYLSFRRISFSTVTGSEV
ncbi:ubiquitin carboxyl-terminal hydrolase 50-like [Halichoeres trimaculatus]|uniref:ubiquitin carboxyl-terminal hydrolase 50-like n=1 Tax=Halichoeres trimaculatus TaxID=147232 RepID=UPI003D9F558D